jgi:hypothetical protein
MDIKGIGYIIFFLLGLAIGLYIEFKLKYKLLNKNGLTTVVTTLGITTLGGLLVYIQVDPYVMNLTDKDCQKISEFSCNKTIQNVRDTSDKKNYLGNNRDLCSPECAGKNIGDNDGCGRQCGYYFGIKNNILYRIEFSNGEEIRTSIDIPVINGTRFRNPFGGECFMLVGIDNRMRFYEDINSSPTPIKNDLEATSCTFCQLDNISVNNRSFDMWFVIIYKYSKKPQLVKYTWMNGNIYGPKVPNSSLDMPTLKSLVPIYENDVIVTINEFPRFYGVLDTVEDNYDPLVGRIVQFSYDQNNDTFVPEVDECIQFVNISYVYGLYIATTSDGRLYNLNKKKYMTITTGFEQIF